MMKCEHPNIVRFRGALLDPLCIAMDYVDGICLFDLVMNHSNHYKWSYVRQIAYELASALDHAHSKKILHRDLKTENCLVR